MYIYYLHFDKRFKVINSIKKRRDGMVDRRRLRRWEREIQWDRDIIVHDNVVCASVLRALMGEGWTQQFDHVIYTATKCAFNVRRADYCNTVDLNQITREKSRWSTRREELYVMMIIDSRLHHVKQLGLRRTFLQSSLGTELRWTSRMVKIAPFKASHRTSCANTLRTDRWQSSVRILRRC